MFKKCGKIIFSENIFLLWIVLIKFSMKNIINIQSNTYTRIVHIKLRTIRGGDRSYRKVQRKAEPR